VRADALRNADLGVDWLKLRVDDTRREDAKRLIELGTGMIAHSVRDTDVDQELIGMLRQSGVCYVPTLVRDVSTFVYADRPEWFDDPFFLEHADMAEVELVPMAEAGLPPKQVLRSATGVAAECLMLDDVGTLEAGKWADFLVLAENPLQDVRATRSLERVYVAGQEVR
jgi:hypothetical protein